MTAENQFTAESPFIEFERTSRRRLGDLNLTPLIDILFILIIFFMLTTSFMRVESLELILPSAAGKAAEKGDLVHMFVYANGEMAIGKRKLSQEDLSTSLARIFEKDPNTKIMLLTADGVTMQQLVGIMDRVTLAGGKSLLVRKWESKPADKIPAWVKPEVPNKRDVPKKPEPSGMPSIRDLYGL